MEKVKASENFLKRLHIDERSDTVSIHKSNATVKPGQHPKAPLPSNPPFPLSLSKSSFM